MQELFLDGWVEVGHCVTDVFIFVKKKKKKKISLRSTLQLLFGCLTTHSLPSWGESATCDDTKQQLLSFPNQRLNQYYLISVGCIKNITLCNFNLYILTSVCIFPMFSIHVLWCRLGDFIYQSRGSLVGAGFLNCCDLNV